MPLLSIDGLPVIDAKKPLVLHVDATDISSASLKEPNDCAVARACRRELHAIEARVHLGRVYIRTNKSSWTRYMTPKTMRQEIIAFDRGGSFEPGEFVLSAPKPSARLGKRSGGKDKPRTLAQRRAAKKRKSPHILTNVRTGPASHYHQD